MDEDDPRMKAYRDGYRDGRADARAEAAEREGTYASVVNNLARLMDSDLFKFTARDLWARIPGVTKEELAAYKKASGE